MFHGNFDMDGVFRLGADPADVLDRLSQKNGLEEANDKKTHLRRIGTSSNQAEEIYRNAFLEVLGGV